MTHDLKTWPEPFAAVRDGSKRYEIRLDDRAYAVGDTLVLREWVPCPECKGTGHVPDHTDTWPCGCNRGEYTGQALTAVVTYKTQGGQWGLPPDVCVLSIACVLSIRLEGE